MAERSNHDVVNQTLSGGDPSPSDVPASTTDKTSAGGDVGEIHNTATTTTTTQPPTKPNAQLEERNTGTEPSIGMNEAGKADQSSTDLSRQGPGPVESRALEVNGVASGSEAGEDTASQGGSESDASRTDGKLNARAKRPASFKPVSFAKFSLPKAPGTPPTMKPNDKVPSSSSGTPLGTPLQSSRPRLVAKTTSLRDSIAKAGANAGRPGGGPDPSQVWNKNRPIQPPPPKNLTDEELKQQYGIHMTSRIQEDGGGTEAKWADIDDDEDDWAPETIEWTDGTKSNLNAPEPAPPSIQDNRIPVELKEEFPPVEHVSTSKDAPKFFPKPTTSVGPNPTVLRLGQSTDRQSKSASFTSKGPSDKVPSSSTSPAPPPVKSPWAPLPPVEKKSPVMPHVQPQPPMRAPMREPPPHDGYSGHLAPKEIAADDFNRSWREMQSGTRELYNSRSGRYEPVPETRKSSWRGDQSLRTPSVLQRPAPGEQTGPAEPSPAFQTHRSSVQDGMHWTRRRTSSNVSGGSGSFGRRMSIGRPDAAQRPFENRRGSHLNGMPEPQFPHKESGPKEMHTREVSPARRGHGPGPSWPPRAAPPAHDQPTAAPDSAAPVAPHGVEGAPAPQGVTQEDPVAMQQRIMKEKRMEARQRRIEQEEKEEAAKRERIRQKLEALGPAPDKAKRRESVDGAKSEAPASADSVHPSHSPPKPPVPEPTGEPKQYGMMKVHHPDTVRKLVGRERAPEKPAPMVNVRRGSSQHREHRPEPMPAGGLQQPSEPQPQPHPQPQDKFPESKVDDQSSQWRGNLNVPTTYSPWSANNLVGASPLTNPWKPLSNDKTLGNGIFEQNLGGFPSRDISLRGPLGLDQPAIAPGPPPFSAPSRSPQESTSISPLPSPEARYDSLSPATRPAPIGPPSSQPHNWQHDSRAGATAAWNNFPAVAAKQDAEEKEKILSGMNAIREGPSSLQATFNETWRQVRTGDQAGQRQVVGISRPADTPASMPNPLPGLDHPVGALPFAETPPRPFGTVPARSSRFFPPEQTKKTTFDEEDYAMRSPSPPPPEEMSSHPVYTGDSHKPLVHLPGPKPVVKLPPKVVAPPPPPPSFASMAAAPPRTAPVSTATSWQEKIDCLFGKKTAHEKKNALAVTSASKEPLDVQLHIAAVPVSFPNNGDIPPGDGEIIAKQVEEAEWMFEDREAGSLPVVRVPTMAPANAWSAAPPPSQARLRAKILKPMQVHSIEPFSVGFFDKDPTGNIRVSIRLPGALAPKTIALPKKAPSHNHHPRARGPSSYKPRKSAKPRDVSGGSGSASSNPKKQGTSNGGDSSPRQSSRGNNASWGPRSLSGSH